MDNQQNSSSSSKLSTQSEATENKVEVGEPEIDKMNQNDSSNDDDGQVAVEEKSINDLPPEMLLKILKNLDTPTLFASRLVDRQWNEVSCEILGSRPDSEITFTFSDSKGFQNRSGINRNEKRSLQNFTKCFKESKNCGLFYCIFEISSLSEPSTFFDHKDWIEFLSDFKNKSLKLKFHFLYDIKKSEILVEKLRDLLNKIPNVEEFGLQFPYNSNSSQVKLFRSTEEEEDKNSSSAQLPNLKVLHVDYSSFSEHPGIFQDLLAAAVNLKKIETVTFHYAQLEANYFQCLHSLGKLHCLQAVYIDLTPEFLSTVKQTTKNSPPPFKLKELRLITDPIIKNPSTWNEATSFISNLFESSKSTLANLGLTPVGFLHGFEFPTFKNLVELTLFQRVDDHSCLPLQMFPPGVNSANVFPAVYFLNTRYMKDWSSAFPHEDSIPRLPSLKSLSVTGCGITGSYISKLALMCPHLKNLEIIKRGLEPPKMNFLEVGRAIWTLMKQLESLEIDVDVDLPENNPNALDSCFTGISEENCQRLFEMTEAVKIFTKWRCQFQIPESVLEPVREFPSILDMKDLRKLVINPYSKSRLLDEKDFVTTKLTWISQECAFKLMPQLEITED